MKVGANTCQKKREKHCTPMNNPPYTGKAEAIGPRIVVRFLEARNLLASDSYSGKSDPICFAFLGHRKDAPLLELFDDAVLMDCVKMTKVAPETVDPIWNEELVLTVGPDSTVQDLEESKRRVLLRLYLCRAEIRRCVHSTK